VPADRLGGFAEALAGPPLAGQVELPGIAQALALEVNQLFPIAAALHMLEFAELQDTAIKLTAAGRVLAESGTDDRKRLFREHLLHFVPLAAHIRQILEEREDHRAPRARFEFELEDHLPEREADATLRTAISWGRYAELYGYDDRTQMFTLDHTA